MAALLPLYPRPRWWRLTYQSFLLAILTVLLAGHVVTVSSYVTDKCYCGKEQQNDATVRSVISNFTSLPTMSKFEYIGARYNGTDENFEPCVCSDVVRIVAELAVTESVVLQEAASNNDNTIDELNGNVTRAVEALAQTTFQNSSNLNYLLHSVLAQYTETNGTRALFTLEFVIKGSDTTIKTKVAEVMLDALSSGTLADVGSIESSNMTFYLRKCLDEPRVGPANTKVAATTRVAGTTVAYTCKPGFRTNPDTPSTAESRCVHETLTWSSPTPTITCVEDKRCFVSPPSMTNTLLQWDGDREEGTEIIYSCKILHKTVPNESVTYQCQNKNWARITPDISCQLPNCGDPPQIPDHGKLTKVTLDTATYRCDTYAMRSGVVAKLDVFCENDTWQGSPEPYMCYGSDVYDAHQEWINFLHITLPVAGGMVLIVILCLLCTRTDSPVWFVGTDGASVN